MAQSGIADPAAAFWTIKHGIKVSGMPAWGRSMEDSAICETVALLQKLPQDSPGMPSPDDRGQPYEVLLIDAGGSATV